MAEGGEIGSGAPGAARSLRSLAQNASLSAVTILLFVAGVEGICRLLEPKEKAPAVAPSIADWAQWEGDFYTVKATAVGWPPFEDYNQDGLRDREHEVDKPAGVRRVVFLGDSTTVGFRIRPEEAHPQVLQDRLDALGQRAEVFTSPSEAGRRGRSSSLIGGSPAATARTTSSWAFASTTFPRWGNNLGRPPAWTASLARRSALMRRVVAAPQREIRGVEELFLPDDSPKVKAAYERFFSDLRTLRTEVEQDGARFGMLGFPFRLQVEPGAPPPRAQQRIAAFCGAEGIPYLDLLPALPLVLRLHDEDADVRRRAATALKRVELDPGPCLPPLEALLDDPKAAGRAEAARVLGALHKSAEPAVPALVRALRNGSPEVRREVVTALGAIGPSAAPAPGSPLLD